MFELPLIVLKYHTYNFTPLFQCYLHEQNYNQNDKKLKTQIK